MKSILRILLCILGLAGTNCVSSQNEGKYTMNINLVGGDKFFISTDSVEVIDFTEGSPSQHDGLSLGELANLQKGIVSLGNIESIPEDGILTGGNYSFTIPRITLFNKNMIISARSAYYAVSGTEKTDSVPTIRISVKGSNKYQKDSTTAYVIGGLDNYLSQQWRLPALPECMTDIKVSISVPSDKQLELKEMYNYYSDINTQTYNGGIRLNSHGSPITGKFNTYEGFVGAAKAGYPCCVAVPKRTKDGIWVCFHDDDNINGLRYDKKVVICKRTINADGDTIYTQYDKSGKVIGNEPMPVSSLTWEFLKDKLVYSSVYYNIWGEQHIPTLSDFFEVCSKTGMTPMLSVHPSMTADEWHEIRDLAERHGILNRLNVKLRASDGYVDSAIEVLGNSVEGYTIYVSSETGLEYAIGKMKLLTGKVGGLRLCIELLYSIATMEHVQEITAAGKDMGVTFTCSVFVNKRQVEGKITGNMLEWGVTEFTTDDNHSYGLNW